MAHKVSTILCAMSFLLFVYELFDNYENDFYVWNKDNVVGIGFYLFCKC